MSEDSVFINDIADVVDLLHAYACYWVIVRLRSAVMTAAAVMAAEARGSGLANGG